MESMDSNLVPWTGHGPFFGWQPSQFVIPCSLWNPYGTPMEWYLPYAIHGLVHVDSMEFPMNLSYKSMYYSVWISWKQIPWINPLNGLSKIVSALEIEHSTLSTCHVYKYENVLPAGLSDH